MRTPCPAVFGVITALVTALSGPASAEAPRLPAGWARGSAAPEKLPPPPKRTSFGTLQSNHEFTFRTRAPVAGEELDLEALPVLEITPSTVPAEPPRELPPGSPGDVVVLKPRRDLPVRVSVQGFEYGFIQVGKSIPTSFWEQSSGGLSGVCGGPEDGSVVPLSYEAIRKIDKKGSQELVWAKGFLDAAACRPVILERWSVRLMVLGDGPLDAFRTRCPACAPGERDVLHVLTPQVSDRFDKRVPFEHRRLSLAPGMSAAFRGSGDFGSRQLEVSQGVGETAAVVFLGRDPRR